MAVTKTRRGTGGSSGGTGDFTIDSAKFKKNLSPSDDTIQKAFEKIDGLTLSAPINDNAQLGNKTEIFSADKVLSMLTYTNKTPVPATLGGVTVGTTFDNSNLTDILNMLLYPYQTPSFTSFELNGISTLEVGDTIPMGVHTFKWTTNNSTNIQPNTIEIVDVTGGNNTLLSNLQNTGSADYMFVTDITSNTPKTYQFKITGTNSEGNVFQTSCNISWQYKVFWGISAKTSLLSSDLITLNSVFGTSRSLTKVFNCNGEYIYFAIPASFGTPTFTVNGLTSTAFVQTQVLYLNQFGCSANYNIFRSTFIQNGSGINITLS